MAKKITPALISTETTLRQSVEYTLRKQETYSPIARNIFALIHFQIKANGDNLFYIFKKDIESITGETTNSTDICQGFNQLLNTALWINDIRLGSNLISSWQQINGELFEVEMSEKLMHYFIDVKDAYTEYTLENMVSLKKKYSKRVYEILAGFSRTGICEIGLEKFKEYLFIKNLETYKDKYPRWVDFDRKVLTPSLIEINEVTELEITCQPKKDGKKVASLIFRFSAKGNVRPTQLTLNLDYKDQEEKIINVLKAKYGLRLDQALNFLRKYSFHEEKGKLNELWIRSLESSASSKGYITNLGAYIVKTYDI